MISCFLNRHHLHILDYQGWCISTHPAGEPLRSSTPDNAALPRPGPSAPRPAQARSRRRPSSHWPRSPRSAPLPAPPPPRRRSRGPFGKVLCRTSLSFLRQGNPVRVRAARSPTPLRPAPPPHGLFLVTVCSPRPSPHSPPSSLHSYLPAPRSRAATSPRPRLLFVPAPSSAAVEPWAGPAAGPALGTCGCEGRHHQRHPCSGAMGAAPLAPPQPQPGPPKVGGRTASGGVGPL